MFRTTLIRLIPILLFFTLFVFYSYAESADKKIKVIIEFQKPGNSSLFYADLLEGIDYSTPEQLFTDVRSQSLKVGIYAELKSDGTTHSLKYKVKTLLPKKGYLKQTIREAHRGYWFADLQMLFKKGLKACKSTRDIPKKQQSLIRLLNWCHSYCLYKEIAKVEKELLKIEKEFPFIEKVKIDPSEKHKDITEAMKEVPDLFNFAVRSSTHITLVTDFLPEKSLERLLAIGERVIQDFKSFMYDPSMDQEETIVDEEILRIISLKKLTSYQYSLANLCSLSYAQDITNEKQNRVFLKLGMFFVSFRFIDYSHVTTLFCLEKGNPNDPNSIEHNLADHKGVLVHFLGHSLIRNRLRPILEERQHVMPWLLEGMSAYLTIKHLNTNNCTCIDFHEERQGGSRTAPKKKRQDNQPKVSAMDLEYLLNEMALDKNADDFITMIQIPHLNRLKPETLAKAFSMISYMLEVDRIGFLNFIDGLQVHSILLFNNEGLRSFYKGIDPLIADCFRDTVIKQGRKEVKIENVKILEDLWRAWASKRVKKKK